ncbi:TPA: DUF285 domain-containing protein, partial [Campylobacter coli]|nr:DUF285 domain-containing protein [Campylobacter coli]
ALEDEINKACYYKNGKAKKIDQTSKNEFLSKLQRIQKEINILEQNLEDEFNQIKNKNKNIFLSEHSYKTFFSSYDELFKANKQLLLKIEQIQHDINNLEQSSKKNSKKSSDCLYAPETKEQLIEYVKYKKNSLADVDVSNITDMSGLFANSRREDFSGIEEWDVSKVEDMGHMFLDAVFFNHDISNWDVSNVTNMTMMFYGCENFNHDISNWDVSNVTDMSCMFYYATNFNQPLEKWDVSSVKDMHSMFAGATNFNQPLNRWDVFNVTDMSGMFAGAINFNQPLYGWDVSSVTNMTGMFEGYKTLHVLSKTIYIEYETSFNQDLTSWDVSNVKDMRLMFDCSAQNPLPYWYKG